MNNTVQGFTVEDTMTDKSYFNFSEIKLFSAQIVSYLGASDIIYSDVIDSFIEAKIVIFKLKFRTRTPKNF